MTQPSSHAETLRRFRRLLLAAPRKGAIADTLDYRDYVPGDDYRRIDWRFCARHDDLRVGVPGDRDGLPVYVLLDCSASMAIGDPSKFRLARTIAAMTAYRALADSRRCGVSAFAERTVADLPALCGLSRVGKVLRFLDALLPEDGATDLARAVDIFVRRYRSHGTTVVITDCCDWAGCLRGLRTLADRGYRPRLVHLYAPSEPDPAMRGDVELHDVESRQSWRAVVTEQVVARYRQRFRQFRDSIREECSRRGIACWQTMSDAPEDDLMRRMARAEPL